MKAHLIDTHLLVPRSRSSGKVKVKYQGHVSQKMGVSWVLVFHKHILIFLLTVQQMKFGMLPNWKHLQTTNEMLIKWKFLPLIE